MRPPKAGPVIKPSCEAAVVKAIPLPVFLAESVSLISAVPMTKITALEMPCRVLAKIILTTEVARMNNTREHIDVIMPQMNGTFLVGSRSERKPEIAERMKEELSAEFSRFVALKRLLA